MLVIFTLLAFAPMYLEDIHNPISDIIVATSYFFIAIGVVLLFSVFMYQSFLSKSILALFSFYLVSIEIVTIILYFSISQFGLNKNSFFVLMGFVSFIIISTRMLNIKNKEIKLHFSKTRYLRYNVDVLKNVFTDILFGSIFLAFAGILISGNTFLDLFGKSNLTLITFYSAIYAIIFALLDNYLSNKL